MNHNDLSNPAEHLVSELTSEWCHLLVESLRKIEHCVSQLTQDQVWQRARPELNSVGNLILHLRGNLQQWGVAGILGSPDKRDRAAEFAEGQSNPSAALLQQLTEVVDRARSVIAGCTIDDLITSRQIQGFRVTGIQALSHTVNHFVGHTHQIVLLTRLFLGPAYQFHWIESEPRDCVPI